MKQKILLFLSSILSQITIIIGVSSVILFVDKSSNVIIDFIMLGISVLLLILSGCAGVGQSTIREPIVVDSLGSKNLNLTKSNDSKSLLLQEKFFNDIMNYCKSIGLNPSISTLSGTAMIVNVKGEEMQDLIPLSLPEGKVLTEKNYNMYLDYMKEQIDTEKLKLK